MIVQNALPDLIVDRRTIIMVQLLSSLLADLMMRSEAIFKPHKNIASDNYTV